MDTEHEVTKDKLQNGFASHSSSDTAGLTTQLIHAGMPGHRSEGAVIMPIYQTATFGYHGAHKDEFLGQDTPPFFYTRGNNPNQQVLTDKLAKIEGTDGAIVFGSGMAAISATLLSLLKPGDHIITQRQLYGATHSVLYDEFPRLNIGVTVVDLNIPDSWEAALTPTSKVFFVESVSNPLLEVGDLKALVAFAKKHGLRSVIDSTFTTPVNFRPASIGFDCVLHSATKYLNGHSDIVAGVVAAKADIIKGAQKKLEQLGGLLDPFAAWLLQRGLSTLALRVRQQNQNGLAIAKFFSTHPKVRKVFYPGLEGNIGHEHAKELFSGFGGVVAVELEGGEQAADAFMHALKIPIIAVSLGGVESLVCVPARSTHNILGPEWRKKAGISDGLVRMAFGIEDTKDLLQDIEQALDKVSTKTK